VCDDGHIADVLHNAFFNFGCKVTTFSSILGSFQQSLYLIMAGIGA